MSKLAQEISQIFWEARKKKGIKEDAVYPLLIEFLKKGFGSRMKIEQHKPLLLRITAVLDDRNQENMKLYLGYSGSDADIVLYPEQNSTEIEENNAILQKYGKYVFNKSSIIYPSVIIQVITKTKTGKLHLENMKAQAWRSMFPRALVVLIGGQYIEKKKDFRFERDGTYFDLVLPEFENPDICRKGLSVLETVIHAHIEAKWS